MVFSVRKRMKRRAVKMMRKEAKWCKRVYLQCGHCETSESGCQGVIYCSSVRMLFLEVCIRVSTTSLHISEGFLASSRNDMERRLLPGLGGNFSDVDSGEKCSWIN